MKKIALCAAVAAAALLAAPVAAAQVYAGVGYTQYDSDAGEVGGITGRLGYRFNPNFAVEGEGTFGTDDDAGTELDSAYGAYAVGILPVGTAFEVHGRVGYQQAEFDGPLGGDDEGLAYGGGATLRLAPNLGIRADYTRLEGDEDTDTWSLGGVVNF
jgi:hypothetical protein